MSDTSNRQQTQREELIEFFKYVQGSPKAWIDFRRDPRGLMRRYKNGDGLSQASQELLLEGEVSEVLEVLGIPEEEAAAVCVIW